MQPHLPTTETNTWSHTTKERPARKRRDGSSMRFTNSGGVRIPSDSSTNSTNSRISSEQPYAPDHPLTAHKGTYGRQGWPRGVTVVTAGSCRSLTLSGGFEDDDLPVSGSFQVGVVCGPVGDEDGEGPSLFSRCCRSGAARLGVTLDSSRDLWVGDGVERPVRFLCESEVVADGNDVPPRLAHRRSTPCAGCIRPGQRWLRGGDSNSQQTD